MEDWVKNRFKKCLTYVIIRRRVMEFCPYCSNYLYIKHDVDETSHILRHYCKNCNFERINKPDKPVLLSSIDMEENDKFNFEHFMNPDLKHDPTLPRVNNIKCVSTKCNKENEEKGNDVLFIKYDKKNMKYLYNCMHCKKFWINE